MDLDEAKIIELAAKQVADAVADEYNIHAIIREHVRCKVDKEFSELADNLVEGIVTDALKDALSKEYTKVNGFGEPVGEATTLKQELERLTQSYWAERVSKTTGAASASYGHISRAEYVMLHALGDDFNKQFKKEAVNVVGALKDGLRANLHAWTDNMLNDVIKVNTLDDRRRKNKRKTPK